MRSQFERYEYKYYLPAESYNSLIRMISPYMKLDPFLESKGKKSYLVRSLYLDTDGLKFYYEKLAGISCRKKLRVRAYDQDESQIFLEIKRKSDEFVTKDRACVHYDELYTILNQYSGYKANGNGNKAESDVINRYISFIVAMQLHHKVLVAYQREAYMGIFDDSVRLTLDSNLCCLPGRSYDLFYSGRNWFFIKQPYVLELKFNQVMPFFFRKIIEHLDLQRQSVSKYCLCVERIRKYL